MVQRITIDAEQRQENYLLLKNDQVHYLRRVLRLSAGDRFIAQDGKEQWLAVLGDRLDQAPSVRGDRLSFSLDNSGPASLSCGSAKRQQLRSGRPSGNRIRRHSYLSTVERSHSS